MPDPHLQHLRSKADLETTYEAVRAGFVALALEKNRRATPYVAEARALKAAVLNVKTPTDLLSIGEIQRGLLTAAGVSDKAAGHLQAAGRREAVEGLIKNFLDPAGVNFVEELVFRFLLTRGDTLGGSMRNVGGFMAQKKLTRAVIACLTVAGRRCQWLHSETGTWAVLPESDADVEMSLRGLSWQMPKGPRTLLYNLKVPFVGNNVDLCLFNLAAMELRSESIGQRRAYVALGELKGGIDPAGADEHWKTARTALARIAKAFSRVRPKPQSFFVGAAIESKMADEIWDMLRRGVLSNAANLTDEAQITAISRWLCEL
jgi:Restriction endonuclease BsobI